ncbi:hypothetical protein RRF57_006861 [Xylaria bambusicola]|uniref:CN hydrolase domain-containing protein n=1 Tax=Xylaria bambusicola TaxID=326684 RepID=A0AAN7ZA27_9PEZI
MSSFGAERSTSSTLSSEARGLSNKMRIGCLQFAPQVGDLDNNISRADAVLSKANPEDLDLLVLPELAFTELRGSGISALWAQALALKLNCVVTIGYPEKEDVEAKWPTSPEYYNSVLAVNPDGETIANYRKTFLYYTDETWALEGSEGFYAGIIPKLGTTAMGICMDINPYKFEAPWHAFEFAFHCLEVEANLIIVTMAWMTREDASLFSSMPKEPDMDTLTYWMARLEPLIRSENEEEIIVVFCNRAGIERDTVYAGTSTVIGIKDGEVNVYGLLGRGEEELLIVDTETPPIAKLVYSPGEPGSTVAPIPDPPSDPDETNERGYAHTASEKSVSTQQASNNRSEGIVHNSTAQNQTPREGASSIGSLSSLVSQEFHSSCQSYSNKASHFSHKVRSSQDTEFGRVSQSSVTYQRATSLGVKQRYGTALLFLTRAQTDRSPMSTQGSTPPERPLQTLSYQSATPMQIPSCPIDTNTVITSTQPSRTMQEKYPKLVLPETKDELPLISHNVDAEILSGASSHNMKTSGLHVLTQADNETTSLIVALSDLTDRSSNAFFWAPSHSLLKVPRDIRPRADSPTLSMEILGILQA